MRSEHSPSVSGNDYLVQRDDAKELGGGKLKGANDRIMEIFVPKNEQSRGF